MHTFANPVTHSLTPPNCMQCSFVPPRVLHVGCLHNRLACTTAYCICICGIDHSSMPATHTPLCLHIPLLHPHTYTPTHLLHTYHAPHNPCLPACHTHTYILILILDDSKYIFNKHTGGRGNNGTTIGRQGTVCLGVHA
jgi:hypothetical protein